MMFDDIKNKHSDKVSSKSIISDLKATRISAVRVLVNDCLRMKLGLWHQEIEYEISVPY